MLVFAISDKGGTGRSVTGGNIAYRRALTGHDVAYLDFDFGSPTSGAIFALRSTHGTRTGKGMHQHLRGLSDLEPERIDIWRESERSGLRSRQERAGNLVLFPGDEGGGEFAGDKKVVERCVNLFTRLDEEFSMIVVDLSAGRSYAMEIAMEVLAHKSMANVAFRWLVFHRWTQQHVLAAANLVYGHHGLAAAADRHKVGSSRLLRMTRFVRTAVVDPRARELAALSPTQHAWLIDVNNTLNRLASELRLGRTTTLGTVPLDPVLQWREQILTDTDTFTRGIANSATVDAFTTLSSRLADDWEDL